MPAQLIDCNRIAAEIKTEVRAGMDRLLAERGVVPGLATVLVGEDPASQVYVGMKNRDATDLGLHSRQITLPAATGEAELLRVPVLHAHVALARRILADNNDGKARRYAPRLELGGFPRNISSHRFCNGDTINERRTCSSSLWPLASALWPHLISVQSPPPSSLELLRP
jgi:hypothetical protein